MQLLGAGSPKPTIFMGNMSCMGHLNAGKLTKSERAKRTVIKTIRTIFAFRLDIYTGWLDYIAFSSLSPFGS